MIYLDNGATAFKKPPEVYRAVNRALQLCASPGRGGYGPAILAQQEVFTCRERAADLFDCDPEQVAFTFNATHGLNMAIFSLVNPGDRVVISGFEHNAVVRPLYGIGADVVVAGRHLFDPENTIEEFEKVLKTGVKAAIFTHCSNVFGYILPVEELAKLCRKYNTPFVIDAAQSAGVLPVKLRTLGADFIAMAGHKGLLGPQGTGILLCSKLPKSFMMGGTGSISQSKYMPDFLPDGAEAGTPNVPGIAGLSAGLGYLQKVGIDQIRQNLCAQGQRCAQGLSRMGIQVFSGTPQSGTVSFVPTMDCQEFAAKLWKKQIAVRGGLHCAPFAHESAGTLETGTVRVSFGHDGQNWQTDQFLRATRDILFR